MYSIFSHSRMNSCVKLIIPSFKSKFKHCSIIIKIMISDAIVKRRTLAKATLVFLKAFFYSNFTIMSFVAIIITWAVLLHFSTVQCLNCCSTNIFNLIHIRKKLEMQLCNIFTCTRVFSFFIIDGCCFQSLFS